ncbi:hypothetical protein D9M71_516610 [compost metagenome]
MRTTARRSFSALIALSSIVFAFQASAAESVISTPSQLRATAPKYHYGMELDIERVISHSPIPNSCQVVPAEMIYEDSQGERHTLQYKVMGNGCHGG